MKIQENIAATIQLLLKEKGLTLVEASDELGISRTALQSYVKADSNPRADTIELIAEKLGISPAELVSGTPEADIPCREKIHPLFEPFIENMVRLSSVLYAYGVPENEQQKNPRE